MALSTFNYKSQRVFSTNNIHSSTPRGQQRLKTKQVHKNVGVVDLSVILLFNPSIVHPELRNLSIQGQSRVSGVNRSNGFSMAGRYHQILIDTVFCNDNDDFRCCFFKKLNDVANSLWTCFSYLIPRFY